MDTAAQSSPVARTSELGQISAQTAPGETSQSRLYEWTEPCELLRLFEAAERIAGIGLWRLDIATQRIQWSDQVFAIFGRERTRGEPAFGELAGMLHPADWQRLQASIAACIASGESYQLTLRVIREDGDLAHAKVYGTAMPGPHGRIQWLVGIVQDISEQQRLEAALRKSEADYRLLIEQQQDLIVKIDIQGRFLFVSPSYCRLFDKREEELLGRVFMPLVHEEDQADTAAAMADLYRPPHHCYLEQRAMTATGWRWLGWSDTAVLDEQGQVIAIIGVGRDIHERKLAEQALEETKRHLELAIEGGGISIYSADFITGETRISDSYLAMLGYAPGEIQVTVDWWRSQLHPDDLATVMAQAEPSMRGDRDRFEAEYRMRHRDGHWVWILDHGRVYQRAPDKAASQTAGVHIDITRRKTAELELAYHANHDKLTGLLNRRGIWDVIKRVHAHCRRAEQIYCIAILDLDLFKQVNDSYGHLVGDGVLAGVASLIRARQRDGDWVGRWGGEELIILMPGTNLEQGWTCLERLRREVAAQAFPVTGRSIRVTFSAGVSACHAADETPDDVISRADRALYRAKHEGRNLVCRGHAPTDEPSSLASLVEEAVREARIWPVLQPIVALQDRALVAEDTLARIRGDDGRVLTAASFIEVARQLDLLHKIDRLVFEETLESLSNGGSAHQVPRFIHISDELLQHQELLQLLAQSIPWPMRSASQSPLVLTIADTQLSAYPARVAETLAPLLERGCRLAVAGFGGYRSSLRLVAELPVSFLILDFELVRLAAESARGRAVLSAIQHGARELGIITIVKRVEDEATARLIASLGVDWGQGYIFGRPSEQRAAYA